MNCTFNVITQKQAEDIANWHYDENYSFYDMEADPEDLEEFLDPLQRGESVFAVTIENELMGFLTIQQFTEKNIIDIGLGMRPDFTGKGMGKEFLKKCVEFILKNYGPERITLSVATFNQRAIKVYKRFGFRDQEIFIQHTNGGEYEFLRMEYECNV
ncbi:GNAT family N-acetyltransferase [Radiobacillus deserti]|uniref:GNAT family N-acetyltransferase n=1 Tax=Radiobacillus deserti TaxID=2594883 RepID=A0A516KL95_9BACI|nr:GNAT family N-acetyltransferase [Radiobacillus deserti]QDP42147.1 GNAT family N-acetyltransferase [Radiobacillus deserti]